MRNTIPQTEAFGTATDTIVYRDSPSRNVANVDLSSSDVASVTAALATVGCPADVAADVAASAQIEAVRGERMLLLLGHGTAIDDQDGDAARWAEAVEQVVQNVAHDNAEAHDRSSRGEAHWSRLWPVPDRRSRRD